MLLDELDFFILRKIIGKSETTTWKLAKEYSWPEIGMALRAKPDCSSNQLNDFYKNKERVIASRLKRMVAGGFVEIKKNSETKFIIDNKKVMFCSHKFPEGYRRALLLKEFDKWVIFEM